MSSNHKKEAPIHIKTLLNKLHPIKRFVYGRCRMEKLTGAKEPALIVTVRPRANSKPRCSGCGTAGPGYDRLPPRLFRFVPLWNLSVFLCYAMRRVDCLRCGVTVEVVPWAEGKNTCCHAMRHFLASWARLLSWKQTALSFHTSWDTVFRSVAWIVAYGLKNRDLEGISALGVDELAYRKGHQYMTLIYQIDQGSRRLLGVVDGRRVKSLLRFFRDFGKARCSRIKVVCSDMWQPYLKVIKKKLPEALNVLDRFHIAKKLGEAVDQVRREEVKSLGKEGYEPILKNARYCFLKRLENLTDRQLDKLADITRYDLRTNRAYFLKEAFDGFWKYNSPQWARWFLRKWCQRTMRSRLEPMKKFVRTLRRHEDLLMNYFKAGKLYNSGIVEGLNLRINLTMRKAYGYKSFDVLKIALFHQLGDLPVPKLTHDFCG